MNESHDSGFATQLQRVLARTLAGLAPSAYCVAFSGGLDSSVLLLALAALREDLGAPLRAVHIEHGLHPRTAAWAEHCRQQAARQGVPFVARAVQVRADHDGGLEAAARDARYAALAALLAPAEVLLTAHQQDDQLETVLLQLARGAGLAGLAAMPMLCRFAGGWHCRPLLEFPRARLAAVATELGIEWIEDDSNRDLRRDRNYMRAVIVPRLRERWPAIGRTVLRSARHCAEALEQLEARARQDLERWGEPGRLRIAPLAGLGIGRRRQLLRSWLASCGLPMPTAAQLAELERAVIAAGANTEPCLRWTGAELRRYRGWLYAGTPLPPPPVGAAQWSGEHAHELHGMGRLCLERTEGAGLRPALLRVPLTIRYRQGGERFRPSGSAHRRALKKLLQEAGVPPWLRARVPLLYAAERLVAVGDLWIAEGCAAASGEPGLRIVWESRPF